MPALSASFWTRARASRKVWKSTLVRALRTLEEAGEPADIATAAAAAGAGGAGGSVGEFPNPYGDGLAAERIADITVAALTGERRRTVDWTGVA